jgi:hypothetical protein
LKSLDSHILYPFLDFLVSNIHCRNTSVPAFRLASKWLMVKNGETFINHGEVWTDVPWYITPQMLPSTMLCHDVMTPPVCVSAFQNCDRIHFTFFFCRGIQWPFEVDGDVLGMARAGSMYFSGTGGLGLDQGTTYLDHSLVFFSWKLIVNPSQHTLHI